MSDTKMQIGDRWAYREKPGTHDHPVWQVEILQFGPPKTNKVRARFLDGEYPGLDRWIPRGRLCVPWEEADAWLREEERTIAAWEASPFDERDVEWRAVTTIFAAYPKPDAIMMGWRGYERRLVRIEDLSTFAHDLGLAEEELLAESLAFMDRFGVYFGPWAVAEKLARRLAEVFAERVLADVGKEEGELQKGTHSGRYDGYGRKEHYYPPEICADLLREQMPIFALVRAWCGGDASGRYDEIAGLRDEVQRLRNLVEHAAKQLKDAGHPHRSRILLEELVQGGQQR